MKNLAKYLFTFSSKVPRPRAPSTAEPFAKKVSDDEMKILMDPRGFMNEDEKAFEQANQPAKE